MPPNNLMLVLVVREAGLRSSLVARLSMAGAEVVTADDLGDARSGRWFRHAPVLILDAGALAETRAQLVADPRWLAVAVIGDGPVPEGALRIARANAPAEIAALLAGWRGEEADGA